MNILKDCLHFDLWCVTKQSPLKSLNKSSKAKELFQRSWHFYFHNFCQIFLNLKVKNVATQTQTWSRIDTNERFWDDQMDRVKL